MSADFDMVVIGSGPGGYVAAIRAAQLGMKTAVIERDRIGGRCLNYACIPAKAVLRSADLLDEVNAAAGFGVVVSGPPQVDFPAVAKRRDRVIKTMTGGVRGLLKKNDVEVIEGHGSIGGQAEGAQRVAVESDQPMRQLSAGNVILATGSLPRPILGLEFGGRVLDTAAAWLLNEQPASLAVIGAGASGVEIASGFGRLGTKVTLIEALPQILPLEDEEIAAVVEKELVKQNVEVLTGAQISAVEAGPGAVAIGLADGARNFDYVCLAVGRAPDVAALGLDTAGIELDPNGLVAVDEYQRTSVPNVYAIGDLVRGPALAHKASEEAVIAAEVAAGHLDNLQPVPTIDIPRATFCAPQVASFGLTERGAIETGRQLKVGRFPMAGVGAATVYGDRNGMIKIIGEAETGELLGAHIVGARAADLISELAVAKFAQIGFQEIARIVHAHPTFSEAVLEAARATDGWAIHA